MAQVLLSFKSDSYVFDYAFLSRHLSFVRFDGQGTVLTLLQENISDNELTFSKSVAIPVVSLPVQDVRKCYNHCEKDIDGNAAVADNFCRKFRWLSAGIELADVQFHFNGHSRVLVSVHNPPFELYNLLDRSLSGVVNIYENQHICVTSSKKSTLTLDAHVASCVGTNMKNSKKFRRRFLKWVHRTHTFKPNDFQMNSVDSEYTCIPYSVEVKLEYPKQKIDYSWDNRIAICVSKKILLEDTSAWLSTLGGGFSALGDYFQHHAEEAGKISMKQLKIAIEMGDPITAAKCRIFYALSLVQQGNIKDSRKIVRMQYRFAMGHPVKDDKLISMCISLWNRLKYLKLEADKTQSQRISRSHYSNSS